MPITYSFLLDSDFTKEEKQAIYRSANLWETVTNNHIKFEFIEKQVDFDPALFVNENVIWRGSKKDTNLIVFEKVMYLNNIIGFAPRNLYIILVPDRTQSIQHFEAVAAHELGHHIGLKHISSIMESNPTTPCITKHDLEEFCYIFKCEPEYMEGKCL